MLEQVQRFLKLLYKVLFTLLKLLFSFFITIFVLYSAAIISAGLCIDSKFDWQILLYEIFSIFTIIGIWIVAFVKVKKRTAIIYALIFILWFGFLDMLPSVKKQLDIDDCLDSGSCAEGLFINTEYGKIEITKENCQKYNWTWNEERKYCKLK